MTPQCIPLALLFLGFALVVTLPGCAVCKKTDTYEQCRTKERDRSQPRVGIAIGLF